MPKVLLCLLLIVCSACAPRGESKSLDEVYQLAKSKYQTVKLEKRGFQNPESDRAYQLAEELAGTKDKNVISAKSKELSEILSNLVSTAGYTTRPAMTELISQYRSLVVGGNYNYPAVKLLAARTINLLAREISTTAFKA